MLLNLADIVKQCYTKGMPGSTSSTCSSPPMYDTL